MFSYVDVDLSRGFDVLCANGKVAAHFDTYAEALAEAQVKHLTVRFWAKKPEKQEEA